MMCNYTQICALAAGVFVHGCWKSWAALSGTAGKARGALFISLSYSMIFRAPHARPGLETRSVL